MTPALGAWGLILGLPGLITATAPNIGLSGYGPYCPVVYASDPPKDCQAVPDRFLGFTAESQTAPALASVDALDDAFDALVVLQEEFFDADYGTWTSAIDWTAAVTQTVVTGTLATLSRSLGDIDLGVVDDEWKAKENLVSSFFAQVVASYFGQDILSIRGEAYDDILWVVLGWIEAIKFVSTHSSLHYAYKPRQDPARPDGFGGFIDTLPWHGQNWICSFAHRARIFWNLATRGWDTKLCHGGMVWSPRLSPYKNAVTNELWVASSVAMYQHFPGDNFTSPWLASTIFPDRDPAHLTSAIEAYRWLVSVNMTNRQGLFVDGYHIDFRKPGNVECDIRDEMVYTYNQGIILTGQRGLWTVTGAVSYLMDGHDLIQSVIRATGWSLRNNAPYDGIHRIWPGWLPPWRGIGRGGILEERCDASGSCSQDGQSFKAVFFHHLTAFCEPLDPVYVSSEHTVDMDAYERVKIAHADACKAYVAWVRHNAVAALKTRDSRGLFGMWWGAGLFGSAMVSRDGDGIDHSAPNTTDYRNEGTPQDAVWGKYRRWLPGSNRPQPDAMSRNDAVPDAGADRLVTDNNAIGSQGRLGGPKHQVRSSNQKGDPNSRGRGRTVETQAGGLALLRAYWEMSRSGG